MEYSIDFFKSILQAAHDEVFVTDGTGLTIYCNKAFEKHYGMKCEEMLGKSIDYLLENNYINQSPIPLVIKYKKEFTIDQEVSTGKKLVLTATPIFDEKQNIKYIVENCRDITEIEYIKSNLEKTQNELIKYKEEIQVLRKKEIYRDEIIFKNEKVNSIFKIIDRISSIDVSILLLGESGTGKSSIARYIHNKSNRKNGPFITINCSTIPIELLESELFGYVKGSFTGANKNGKIGLVELADGGTLFLDEIGEIPLSLQVKFLELIQEHKFTPIGSIKSKHIDMRIISATNQNLDNLIKEKRFRQDLYYRLNVINFEIPPLRERKEDIKPLCEHFLKKYNNKYNMNKTIPKEIINVFKNHNWNGNIRELEHTIEQLIATSSSNTISLNDLPKSIFENISDETINIESNLNLDEILEKTEKEYILSSYKKLKSSYKVAVYLGISQSKASRLIRKYT